jgi:hypothetical protein
VDVIVAVFFSVAVGVMVTVFVRVYGCVAFGVFVAAGADAGWVGLTVFLHPTIHIKIAVKNTNNTNKVFFMLFTP